MLPCQPEPKLKLWTSIPSTTHISWKSGLAFRVGPGSGFSLSKCFGPISGLYAIFFRNYRHFCHLLVLKQSSWLNLQKVSICELFSLAHFATPPIPRSCAYLDSHTVNLAFGPKSGFKTICWAGCRLHNEARIQLGLTLRRVFLSSSFGTVFQRTCCDGIATF